jgi:hypothetical protein
MKAVFIFAALLAACLPGEGHMVLNPADQRAYDHHDPDKVLAFLKQWAPRTQP